MEKRLALAGFGLAVIILSLTIGVAAAQNAPAPTPPCGPNLPADIKNVAKDSRCFELRTYTVREGSSIDLLHKRFRERTTALFKKHGMTIIGYWQPVAKPNTLIYILAYKDAAARDAAWSAFGADPDWLKARAETEKNGQIVASITNTLLAPTSFSSVK